MLLPIDRPDRCGPRRYDHAGSPGCHKELTAMSLDTALLVGGVTALLILLGVLHRLAERKEAKLRQGRPKRGEHDPPWRYP